MNILQITNRIPFPLNDGGNMATYNVSKYLNNLGHKVTMLSMNTKKHYQEPEVISSVAEIHAVDVPAEISLKGVLKGIFKKMPYNVERFVSKEFSEALEQLLKEKHFDVIQLEGIYLATYADLIKKYSKAPLILRSHNIEHQIWKRLRQKENNIIKKLYLQDLARKIKKFELNYIHKFDGIIAITEQDEAFYQIAGYKKPLTVINAGVDMEVVKPVDRPVEPYTVCFLGSLEWKPNAQGLDWFLNKVWPVLKRKVPQVQFHIAGKNPPGHYQNINIEGVTFHGMVPDAREFLNKYDIVIVPLFSGGGMRLKIVEAMALKKCIVTTSVGVEGIKVKHGKHLVIADSAKKFTKEIICLLKDAGIKDAIRERAYEQAKKKYDWGMLIKDFEKFYNRLV